MNYFELFNLKPQFSVDQTLLASTYQRLQQLTHPDKFATASDRERLLAVQKNAQVNDAYQTLKTPLSRAEYLLELRGLNLQHEQQTLQDNAFLMQQMSWREQLEEIDQASEPQEQLDELDTQISQLISKQLASLEQCLADVTDEANQQAANMIRKLKFMYKLRQEIALKDEQLNDY